MATDQEIRDAGFKYIPQQKYLLNPFEIPVEPESPVVNQGIVNTNAFAGSGGDGFNPAGNAFGEGTAVSPVFGNSYIDTVKREGPDSFAAYDKLSQAGGTAPAGMYQTDYFPGTQNELVDAMGRMPGQEGYDPSMDYSEDAFQKADDKRGFLSRLMNNAKQKMTGLPDWAQAAITTAGMLNPFTAIPKLLGMSGGDGGPSYGIAGLSDAKKGAYDALASGDMLFKTPGGYKTLTGKNFQAKNYVPNQLEIYDRLKDIDEDDLTGWQKKQLLESTAIFNEDKKALDLEGKIRLGSNLVQDTTYKSDPKDSQTGIDNYTGPGMAFEAGNTDQGGGFTGGQVKDTGGVPGGKYGSPRKDGGLMYANGGRAGYFYGGRVNYKVGGRTDAESQYGADSVGSYDSSANQSDRGQSYGINNNPPVSTGDNNKIVTTDFINTNPSITVDYTDPKNYASLYGKIGFNNILDNDDINADGTLSGKIGPIGYYTNFTDQGITGTNLTAGNFNANISPDMQLKNLSYSKGPFRISSDGQNTTAGITFSYKNGGLASLL